MKRIAVIGAGVSGLTAAWALRERAEVHLFEREDRIGGHAHTVDVEVAGAPVSVDVGFIVFNRRTYPNLVRMFSDLGVLDHASDMSFGVERADGFSWSSANFLRARDAVFTRRFGRLAKDAVRFKSLARKSLAKGDAWETTLDGWLDRHVFSHEFRDDYLVPMTSAIWSTPMADVGAFPASAFLRFMVNHGLTDVVRPRWRTVRGGSRHYVEAIEKAANFVRRLRALTVRRLRAGAEVNDGKSTDVFDSVVFACHPEDTLACLCDADATERALLSAVRYSKNRVVLHTDRNLMPASHRHWASWSVVEDDDGRSSVSYWMNRLQPLKTKTPVFVTLNPTREPRRESILFERSFDHPLYDLPTLNAQNRFLEIQGRGGVFHTGAWTGYGFHEDGAASGLWAAERLGARLPWRPDYDRLSFLQGAPGSRGSSDATEEAPA